VKSGFYNVLYALVSNIAIGLCFVPFLFLCWKKMRKDRAYWVVGIYWLANGLINLFNLGPDLNRSAIGPLQERLTFIYNLIDTPLLLLLFFYAASGKRRKNQVLLSMLLFVALELALLGWKGYNFNTGTMITGAGLLLVLTYSISGLMHYMRSMEHTSFENSMVCVYAALLFAYGSFMFIYIFIHVYPSNFISSRDTFMLYYFGLLLAAVITIMGLWGYGIRRQPYSSSSS
jgi:hypothetical protein